MTQPQITWEQVHAAIAQISRERGEWAGMPMPVKDMAMVIHPSYPFAKHFASVFMPEPSVRVCRDSDVREDVALRNSWRSHRDGKIINLWREGDKFFFTYGELQNSARLVVETIGASRAWDINAELRAMDTLRRHVTQWAFECYLMTGSFIETSTKSKLMYVFRRLRPTIAMTGNPDFCGRDRGVRILACLCAHPIGYYQGSWSGALVPTDDVLAHLLLMRSDEHLYWKQCNQHPAWAPESGI